VQFESYGLTDRGLLREHNEDHFLANDMAGLFLVADGMGGLSKVDLASQIAIETIGHFIAKSRVEDITWPAGHKQDYSLEQNRFLAAISMANWNIYETFRKDIKNEGMGTTLTGFLVDEDQLVTANVGDSRIYRIRNNMIQQITQDHSLVMEEVRKGRMTLEEARDHPQKHIINRALGISDATQVDIALHTFQSEDLYLLCTDGLSDMISDEHMISLVRLNRSRSLKTLAESLIDAANNQGGLDNVTVVLVCFYSG
jgi:protein phosphatase